MSFGLRKRRIVDDLLAEVDPGADKVTLHVPVRDAAYLTEAMRSKGYDVHKKIVSDASVEVTFARANRVDPEALWRTVQERFVAAGLWCHRHQGWTDRNVCTARCEIVPVFMSEASRPRPALRDEGPGARGG